MTVEDEWQARGRRFLQLATATYTWHRAAFIAFNVVVTLINIAMGPPWWGIWPLLVTGLVFTIHFLIFKAATVDEDWVEERAGDLFEKSYDQGHIEFVANRHDFETPRDRTIREHEEKAGRRAEPRDDNPK